MYTPNLGVTDLGGGRVLVWKTLSPPFLAFYLSFVAIVILFQSILRLAGLFSISVKKVMFVYFKNQPYDITQILLYRLFKVLELPLQVRLCNIKHYRAIF